LVRWLSSAFNFNGWVMTNTEIISNLSFPKLTSVYGFKSIAHLFGSSKPRCGIYLLAFPGEKYYIGQATDIVRRFSQHFKTYERIDGFTFLKSPRSKLDALEKDLIYQAEKAGLTLLNVIHVSNVVGETDLDVLFDVGVLERWIKDPSEENLNDLGTIPITLPLAHNQRASLKFVQLQAQPLFTTALTQLFAFLDTAIPYPRTSEFSFWAVSAMPGTNRNTLPRMLCVNVSMMEVFSVGYYLEEDCADLTWSFINVASDVFYEGFGSLKEFELEHPDISVNTSPSYRDGGQLLIKLDAFTQNCMINLLLDQRVTKAAATLCLRLMRKRPTIFSKFHCPQLVDAALSYRELSDDELAEKIEATCIQD